MKKIIKINWGTVLVDITIIVTAGITGAWVLILLVFFTGSYKLKYENNISRKLR